MDKSTSILIVGTGTIGLSTAWELGKRGFKNVTCIDPYPVPSKISAGFDISKIVRTQYKEPLYAKLAHEALAEWNKAPLNQVFYKSGIAYLKSSKSDLDDDPLNQASGLGQTFKDVGKYGDDSGVKYLGNPKDLKDTIPELSQGDLQHITGWIDTNCGWACSYKAMEIVAKEAEKLGVKFLHGRDYTMKNLVRDNKGLVIGVETETGKVLKAQKIILSAGAWAEKLIDYEGQVASGAFPLAHINLTKEEADKYRNMPITALDGIGFCCPPNEENVFKFSDLNPVRTNYVDGKVSVPDTDGYLRGLQKTVPERDLNLILGAVQAFFPDIASKPVDYTRFCWDQQTFDSHWILGYHPSSCDSLFIATGGSGHTFKNLPNVGKYVVDGIEKNLPSELAETWRWRPDKITQPPPVLYDLKSNKNAKL